jgi:hypothetical protein
MVNSETQWRETVAKKRSLRDEAISRFLNDHCTDTKVRFNDAFLRPCIEPKQSQPRDGLDVFEGDNVSFTAIDSIEGVRQATMHRNVTASQLCITYIRRYIPLCLVDF